ncbi:ParB/RepB/Spo0J family partition protein [Deinococcus sp.]|uniref:ParB/RepB/Spo0J family partition protein n=1 Tax=Deinococcus sp. TaxID=47478 RepID=UPI0025C57C62|nr:ParB/RepB/Spo0J family partition protein [Deinococcus sp.]
MSRLSPDVQAALRAATISEDGLTLTLAGQLDRKVYQATAKAIETLGGKWNRKAGAHLFQTNARDVLARVLDGEALPKKNPLAYFATPEELARQVVNAVVELDGVRVLEPSAGTGALADVLREYGAHVDVIELDDTRRAHLQAAGYRVVAQDFLTFTPSEPYPAIVMNPPFRSEDDAQAYIAHIEHAWTHCLAPGGTLVAIAPSGFTFRQDRRAAAFREFVEQHGEYGLNDERAFVESGTGVQTATVYVRKPAEEAVMPVKKATSKNTDQPGHTAFQQMVKETREKMNAQPKGGKKAKVAPAAAQEISASSDADLPFPVSEAQLEAAMAEPAPAPGPILNTDQLNWLPVTALVASPLNPRKKFPQEALDSLANSIAAKGLMQNLVGRIMPGADTVEVIAGGRRLRALTLLHDTGRLPDGYLVPVRVQDMTDLDALMLAVAENSERADVEPLEEADAFVEMIRLGASVEDIALRFKCSARTVEKRLVLAEGLGEDARTLLADGKIVISQAQVIAQTSGPLREHVITAAKRGDSAQRLRDMIASCTFLVERAKFDVATSGLEIIEDLFGDQPARFADPQAALALQLAWVEERRKTLSKKKEQHFVDVVKLAKQYLHLPHDAYTAYGAPDNIKGTVIMVSTQTGEVKQERCAREADIKSARAKEQAADRAKTASEATGSEGGAIRKSGWVDAHQARATALRAALVGDHKRTVALTILSLLQATPVSLRASLEYSMPTPIPTGLARLKEIDAKVGGQLGVNGHHLPKRPITHEFKGYNPEGADVLPYLDLLMTLSLEDLLDVQSVLIAQAVGGWSEFNPMHAPYAFVTRLAADTGATVQMKLTDAHLKAYPRDRLIELAEDAGIAEGHGVKNGHISTLTTNTEIRAAILQHADALAERGYVPPLARFPEVADTAQARKYRQDAKDLVARLDGQQISSLLEDLGIDPTADTAADGLNVLQQEIDDMSDAELQDWQGLRDMAQPVPATATAAD